MALRLIHIHSFTDHSSDQYIFYDCFPCAHVSGEIYRSSCSYGAYCGRGRQTGSVLVKCMKIPAFTMPTVEGEDREQMHACQMVVTTKQEMEVAENDWRVQSPLEPAVPGGQRTGHGRETAESGLRSRSYGNSSEGHVCKASRPCSFSSPSLTLTTPHSNHTQLPPVFLTSPPSPFVSPAWSSLSCFLSLPSA